VGGGGDVVEVGGCGGVGEGEGVCFGKGGDASVGCVCEGSKEGRQTGEDEGAEILRVY
jgi:hypothetical protein